MTAVIRFAAQVLLAVAVFAAAAAPASAEELEPVMVPVVDDTDWVVVVTSDDVVTPVAPVIDDTDRPVIVHADGEKAAKPITDPEMVRRFKDRTLPVREIPAGDEGKEVVDDDAEIGKLRETLRDRLDEVGSSSTGELAESLKSELRSKSLRAVKAVKVIRRVKHVSAGVFPL